MSYIILFKDEKKAFSVKINEAKNKIEAINKARDFLINVKKRAINYVYNLEVIEIKEVN